MRRHTLILVAALTVALAACTEAADDPGETDVTDVTLPTVPGETTPEEPATTPADTDTTPPATEPPANGAPPSGETLGQVQDRGNLVCGVNSAVPGFGFVDADGNYSGFDIDYCRALAVAVLGDAEAVEYVPLDAEQRFTALAAGEIDVLIRNTTFTASRDGGEGATFLATTFYDGQGMMVLADSGFTTVEDMANVGVCVLSGTTTELNLATRFGDIPYTPLTFSDNETLQAAFIAGQCDGWTSDKSQLAGVRFAYPEAEGGPESLVILDETFSKEPLGPAVRDGDSQWAQIVNWVTMSTILAEELEIDSTNVEGMTDTDNDDIRRFLGLEITDAEGNVTTFDPGLGLEPGWPAEVIASVGNYAEIYERNVAALGVPRGLNELYTNGGILYAMPYR